MRTTYRVLAYVIAGGVALQAAIVAMAFFDILVEVDDGGIITADYDYEGTSGSLSCRSPCLRRVRRGAICRRVAGP